MSVFSQTFPELSELEHEILSLSKEINWLESQAVFFDEIGKTEVAGDFARRMSKAIRKLKALETLKELS